MSEDVEEKRPVSAPGPNAERVGEVLDRAVTTNTRLFLLLLASLTTTFTTGADTHIAVLTGQSMQWECVSERCHVLRTNHTREFYSRELLCGSDLIENRDFNWTDQSISFVTDWGIYCSQEGILRQTNTLFFFGAFLGLVISSVILDRVGRKYGAMFGMLVASVATLSGAKLPNFQRLLVIRVFQGIGQAINFMGVYCWIMEFSPRRLREVVNMIILSCWSLGYFIIVIIAYFIPHWRYVFLTQGIIDTLSIAPLLIMPTSPRFSLIRDREADAKNTLESLSNVCNSNIPAESIRLTYETRVQTYRQHLIEDFKTFPLLLRQTIICAVLWFLTAFLYAGFSFKWNSVMPSIYSKYSLTALFNVVAILATLPACKCGGRRKPFLLFMIAGMLSNFISMTDVTVTVTWHLEHVAGIVRSICVVSCVTVMFLHTCEIAPTSHRGCVMSVCGCAATIGCILAPYLISDVADRLVPLGIFAGVAFLTCVIIFFLPETANDRLPDTPRDVVMRAGETYQSVEEG